MDFHEEYTTEEKKAKDFEKEKDKTVLSNDAYAVSELLEQLFKKLEHLRISSVTK